MFHPQDTVSAQNFREVATTLNFPHTPGKSIKENTQALISNFKY